MTDSRRNKLGVGKRRTSSEAVPSGRPNELNRQGPTTQSPAEDGSGFPPTDTEEVPAGPSVLIDRDSQMPSLDAWELGAEWLIGSVVVDAAICNYHGINLASVVVGDLGPLKEIQTHPQYIRDQQAVTIEPIPNRPKVHLVGWHAPIEDQGNIVLLEVAKSDFWTSVATKSVLSRLQSEIEDGTLELISLPRRLDVHLVVICGVDNKILLTFRSDHVATEPQTWMVTVGESMDWGRDSVDGVPQPVETARHCLKELDELNLTEASAEAADLVLIAVATEWTEMLANLVVIARIPLLTFDEAKKRFRRGENVRIDAIEFTAEACAPLITSGRFRGGHPAAQERLVSDISRAALLAALRHQLNDPEWDPAAE